MPDFKEDLLQFIWRHRLLEPGPYISQSGNIIEVISPGELNKDAGPDFFNGAVRVNGVSLFGNIEIHIRTSDWLRHRHQTDQSYDRLILHVVSEHDTEISQNTINNVEVLELRNIVLPGTIAKYRQLCEARQELPCSRVLKTVSELKFKLWMERMTIERLEEKVTRINDLFINLQGDYHQLFYLLLLRNFGFKVNALPMQMLAGQLPVQLLLKHSDNLLQVEALLFGMAGLLGEQYPDPYLRALQNEFEFLSRKYQLIPLQKEIFKFSRLRPANFPTVRLAQFAALVHNQPGIFSSPGAATTAPGILNQLLVATGNYWNHHYMPGGDRVQAGIRMGTESAENILINTFAPFYFFYAKKTGLDLYAGLALDILERTKVENNQRTRLFSGKKELLRTAAHSQGAINLYENYCVRKKCLQCGIGVSIMAGN
jgi:hypothetical protein